MGLSLSTPVNNAGCACLEDYEEKSMNVFPDYYLSNPHITPEDLECVKRSWNKVINGTCLNFKRMKSKNPKMDDDGAIWFGELFYEQFFEEHPAAMSQFGTNMSNQTTLFPKMMTSILDMIERPNDVHISLIDLAVRHSKYGVHAIQYGIFGQSLLNTLKLCLREEYTDYVNQSWIKVYSFILSVVVPIALAEDRKSLWDALPRYTQTTDNDTTSHSSLNKTESDISLQDSTLSHSHQKDTLQIDSESTTIESEITPRKRNKNNSNTINANINKSNNISTTSSNNNSNNNIFNNMTAATNGRPEAE